MSIAPVLLTPSHLDEDRRATLSFLESQLALYRQSNDAKYGYYEGEMVVRDFGISTPPAMLYLKAVAGWPATVVDVLEERLDWLGWRDDQFGLADIYATNALDVESGMAHLDALLCGTAYAVVGAGGDGEPSPLVTVESPNDMTCVWDRRRRVVSQALYLSADSATLYEPDQTVALARDGVHGEWQVVEVDRHRLGRVPVVRLTNRVRGSRTTGRSEITRAVRYYTDAAVRTLRGMEVNREFYSAPQRWAMNVDQSRFTDAAGQPASPWQAISGRVWAVPPNEDGEPSPTVGQFDPASPAPYLDQVRGLAQLLAAEAGIPAHYLGFVTDNPASADAIRAGEARLVKRAERRQASFGRAWMEVARLALLVRDNQEPDLSSVSVRWRDPATPTRAAAADEVVKLVGAGVLAPTSAVALDRLGFSPDEQTLVQLDARRAQARQLVAGLTGGSGVVATG